jgi:membrane protease YdiL (CAAX protease family)
MLAVPIALSYAVLIGLIAVVARVKFGRRLRALPGFGRATARAHVLGLFVGLALYGFNVAFALVVDVGIEQTELFHAVETLADLAVLALPVVVLAPIFEELLFRGLYFHAFEARGARDAIVLSATLFAVVHFLTYSKAPLAVLPVFVVGLANGWLRARTGSIEPGITSHAVFNALGLVSWALQLSQRG